MFVGCCLNQRLAVVDRKVWEELTAHTQSLSTPLYSQLAPHYLFTSAEQLYLLSVPLLINGLRKFLK